MRAVAESLHGDELASLRKQLTGALTALERCIAFVCETYAADPRTVLAGAVPFLKLFGITAGGWQMGRAALIAQRRLASGDNADRAFYQAKLGTARFYADHCLPQAAALAHTIIDGAAGVLALEDTHFTA
jgi:acyl-CoA dehydrogenase